VNNILLIPARIKSSRLPNKPLLEVGGKSIIERVYEQCLLTGYKTLVLTDGSPELAQHCSRRGIEFLPVYKQEFPGGTQSILSSLNILRDYDNLINVQGDCPDIDVSTIKQVVDVLEKQQNAVITSHYMMNYWEEPTNSHVKLVTNDRCRVLYFSREKIPHNAQEYKIHIGIYGFPYKLARYISSLHIYHPFTSESLEQLHWLYHDIPIYSIQGKVCHAINTKEDLSNYEKSLTNQ
jgi:3-deoxy-manno-octulosonate cytidylyltransferase (CMP-KDO synthetase)